MKQLILVTCVGRALWSSIAAAADVKVLSAGAVEPGLQRAAEQFKRASGNEIKMQFNTAPQLAKRMAEGEVADILIAPPAILDEQAKNGKISMQGRFTLGRVSAGVVARSNAPSPEIATTEALKRAMLSARTNRARSHCRRDRSVRRLPANLSDVLPLAQSRHGDRAQQCPLLGVKRTSRFLGRMSAYDPKRTWSVQDCCRAN
jgi:Bacterial extracellular solute-binding protein